jgi:predicted ATPase
LLLGGSVNIYSSESEPLIETLYSPLKNISLEMPIASSMVKELSSLVLYLRFIAKPRDWIIIDEPEMNLHPEAQMKMTEFLAMLCNEGLNVLITTHSPYVVDHLANLMKASEHPDKISIKNKFFLKDEKAFISKDDVSVYLFDKGKSKNILKDGIINWGTFANVSDKVSKIFFEI